MINKAGEDKNKNYEVVHTKGTQVLIDTPIKMSDGLVVLF